MVGMLVQCYERIASNLNDATHDDKRRGLKGASKQFFFFVDHTKQFQSAFYQCSLYRIDMKIN